MGGEFQPAIPGQRRHEPGGQPLDLLCERQLPTRQHGAWLVVQRNRVPEWSGLYAVHGEL